MTYEEALVLLGKKDKKKLEANTWLIKCGDHFVIQFHQTYIVRLMKDGKYVLQTGGERTVTTKRRLNKYTPVKVCQKNFQWYIGSITFFDGVEVDRHGTVLNSA